MQVVQSPESIPIGFLNGFGTHGLTLSLVSAVSPVLISPISRGILRMQEDARKPHKTCLKSQEGEECGEVGGRTLKNVKDVLHSKSTG